MVTDNDIIQLFNNNGNPDTGMLKKFNYLDTEIQVYVKNRWNDIPGNYYTNKESIYRIINNIQIRPVCKYCGKPVKYMGKQYLDKIGKTVNGYRQYCSFECSCKDINRIKKRQQTCLQKYGVSNSSQCKEIQKKIQQTCIKKYGVKNTFQNKNVQEKAQRTCLKKYGVINPFQSTEIKDKIKQHNIEKYGVEYVLQSPIIREKIKQTCLEKYGVDHIWKSEIIKNNIRETNLKLYGTENVVQSQYYIDICKERGVFNYSKPENELYDILTNLFSEHDLIRQYKSDVYPFKCDFYLKPYNLYIEYHGSWYHNYHPFNENNIVDQKLLEKLKEKEQQNNKKQNAYTMAIKTWTYYDVTKLNLAIQNKLNYLVIYPNIDFNILTNKYMFKIKGIKIMGNYIKQL